MFSPIDPFKYINITKSSFNDSILFEQKFINGTFNSKYLSLPNTEYSEILTDFKNSKIAFSFTAAIFVIVFAIFIYAIYRLLFIYKRSPYIPFLTTMFIMDCIVIIIIILDNLVFIHWKHMCCTKFMALNFVYVANLWLMAGMYFQRYISVYHPMLKFRRHSFWRYLTDTKVLLAIAIAFGSLHMGVSHPRKWNLASPVIIFDDKIYVCNNAMNNLKTAFDYVRYALCNLLSYITPVIIDISLNVAVIFYKTDNKTFFDKNSSQKSDSSRNTLASIEHSALAKRRRDKRIIMCLIIVSVQLILYIPILVCAFILTFLHLTVTPYIAAISFFLMYPYKLIVAHLLCRDYKPKPKQSKEQLTDTTSISSLVNNSKASDIC